MTKPQRNPTGLFIRDARQQLNLTQLSFSALLGVPQAYLSNYETGRTMPPAKILMKILKIFKEEGRCPICDRVDAWQK